MEAAEERRSAAAAQGSASAQRIGAAEMGAEAIRAKQEADALAAEKNRLLDVEKVRNAQAAEAEANRLQIETKKSLDVKDQQLKAMDNQTFWGDQKTWQKVLWGISMALGSFGAALSGGQNGAFSILGNTLNQWSQRRQQRMKTLQDEIATGRSKLGTVGLEYLKREQELEPLRMAAARGRIGDIAEREAKALQAAGDKDAAARAFKLVADIRAEEAKLRTDAAREEEKAQQFLAPTATSSKTTGAIVQNAGAGVPEGAVMDRQTGKPIGVAPSKVEGAKSREMLGQLRPIEKGLDGIEAIASTTGLKERVFGSWAEKNQKIAGLLTPLLPQISQFTGSGTPQDKEAQRLLDVVTSSIRQGKEVTLENIRQLRAGLQGAYDAKAQSLVPGYKPPSDQGKAAEYKQLIEKASAAGDKATVDALTKEMNAL